MLNENGPDEAEEFSADDDVCLILKGFHYDHHRPWLERVIRRCGLQRRGAPELCYTHETLPSVAPLLTATDVGVFPLRAECTGLPVLEFIAAGRPVITQETGFSKYLPTGKGLYGFRTMDDVLAAVDSIEVPGAHGRRRPVARLQAVEPDQLHGRAPAQRRGSERSIDVPGTSLPTSSTALRMKPESVSA